MESIFKECQYDSQEYHQCLDLRTRILRAPLGLGFSKRQILSESGDSHLGVFDANSQLVGCLVLTWPKDPKWVKIRQVAISPEKQRNGLGTRLTHFAEIFVKDVSPETQFIYCHARESAVPFYQRQGYKIAGDPFEEVSLVHFRMEKHLK